MTDPVAQAPRVAEVYGMTPARFAEEIVPAYRPVVLRGLVADWPAVAAGRQGPAAMAAYLRQFQGGRPLSLFAAAPEAGGRFFYSEDHRGFNFQTAKVTLAGLLDSLLVEASNPDAPSFYAGSAPVADAYPGWAEANALPLPAPDATPRLWVGNASRVSTHYDMSSNIAAVVAGRRRFALFPPEQTANLYVGPLEHTIAGQPTSMADLEAPDLVRYPRFADALHAMQVAELEPGDALFIPSLWWHDVRATGPLNVLANYWWEKSGESGAFAALVHALLAVRDLPTGERGAVRAWFDHFVFADDAANVADHLPEHARGIMGPASPERTRQIEGFLRRTLSRD